MASICAAQVRDRRDKKEAGGKPEDIVAVVAAEDMLDSKKRMVALDTVERCLKSFIDGAVIIHTHYSLAMLINFFINYD